MHPLYAVDLKGTVSLGKFFFIKPRGEYMYRWFVKNTII